MTKENGYNGYSNYETWAVCLWLDNDQGLYEEARYMARAHLSDAAGDADSPTTQEKEDAAQKMAKWVKNWIENMAPELDGLWADLLNAALSEVDWLEVAQTRFDE